MGKGQQLREKLSGGRELLDFSPWDGRMVPCMVLGTVMGTEFVVGHMHLMALSIFLPAFLPLSCRTLLSITEVGGGILTKASSGWEGRLH